MIFLTNPFTNTSCKTKKKVDKDASWVKKAGRIRYGFKKHIITDDEGLVVIAVKTTKASTHDSKVFEDLVSYPNLAKDCEVQADKAYKSKGHDDYLRKLELANGTQYQAYRNKPLTKKQTDHNKRVSKTRYMVERTFGSIVLWFGAGKARYVGLEKTHTQHVLESIAYNLKRMPNLATKQKCCVCKYKGLFHLKEQQSRFLEKNLKKMKEIGTKLLIF